MDDDETSHDLQSCQVSTNRSQHRKGSDEKASHDCKSFHFQLE